MAREVPATLYLAASDAVNALLIAWLAEWFSMTIRNTWRGCVLLEVDEVCPQAVTTKATAAMATQRFIYSEFTEYGSQEALRQTTGMFLRSCQLRPGLFAAAVTTVPFSGCDVRLSTHETDVLPL